MGKYSHTDLLPDNLISLCKESQLSDTIAFVATYISSAEDMSKVSFHPTLKFLANWLETEERAVTSHQIGSELVTCAKAAQSLADKELFARFLAGFYKATNDEQPARPGCIQVH